MHAVKPLEVPWARNEAAAQFAVTIPSPELFKTATLDVAKSFRNAAMAPFDNADIVHDRFHIAHLLGDRLTTLGGAESINAPNSHNRALPAR